MLVPVSGIVQFGRHAMADRFAYLPCIGLFTALLWFAGEALRCRLPRGVGPGVLMGGVLAALAAATVAQTGKWRDSVTLYTHSLAHTSGNWLLELNLGNALLELGRTPEAEEHYRTALRLKPDFLEARLNLGNALLENGRVEEGVAQYREVVRQRPADAKAHNNLGVVLYERGEYAAAAASFREVLRLRPGDAKTHENLAVVLSQLGWHDEAAAHRREAERLRGAQGLKVQEAAPQR
jgi:Flp pilus assembly protein TadD